MPRRVVWQTTGCKSAEENLRLVRQLHVNVMSKAKVISLDAAENMDQTAVGAKVMGLVRLNRIGLAVPPGFCITATVLAEHFEQNNLTACLKSSVDELGKAKPEAKGALLTNVRQAIIEAPLAEALRREMENHYRALGADRVAVRSSGTAEDLPGHSFAGQYDSYLGIANLEDCMEAVRKCWASLWTLRAYEYREKMRFDHLKTNMAVIVQSLIDADSSGVIFTVEPLSGNRSSIVIEACFGLGETLVSGKVTPDRFVVDKKKLKLLSHTISDKKTERVLDPNGTVKEQSILKQRSPTGCLDEKQIRRLAKLARKIETEFGSPQDIEWAICKRKVYFLQSRPITALPPEKSWEDRQIWCNNPAKEVLPDVVTPVTSSVIGAMLDDFIDPVFRMLCINRGNHPIYGLVAGRLYFNANMWGAVFRDLPGGKDFDFMRLTGSNRALQQVVERLRTASDKDLPNTKFKRYKFFLKIPLIIVGALRNTPGKGQRIITEIAAKNEKWSRLDVASLSSEQIAEYCCQDLVANFRELLGHVLYLLGIFAAFPILYAVCAKWLLGDGRCAEKLLAGLGDMDDAVAGLDLWRLAAAANASTEVKDLISSDDPWCTIESKLSQTDSGKDFLAQWDRFMGRHGHHCRGEIELYNPRWFETPDYILKLVRSYITQMDEIDPVQNHAKRAQQRRQLEQQCRRQLKNPVKRLIFNHLLVRSQKGSVFRENVKSEVVKLLTTMRKMLIELGRRLRDQNVLKNRDDIFFLRLEEITPVVEGKADFDIEQVIASRQAEYNKNRSITPPDVVFGKFDPENFVPDLVDTEAELLSGLAVSPGVATGKARVILRADSDEQLLAGEILVAPFTDPGWTPYFVPAAAIVMDQGGVISHGSIVAREYGIPAVVNVGGGTKIIKTGQTIQVDGNHGVVRILP